MLFVRLVPVVLLLWAANAAGQDYRMTVTEAPFSYQITVDGDVVVEENIADTAHTALYYITADGAQYFDAPLRFEATDTHLDATFSTTDGRRALLRIEPSDHGGYRLELTFEPHEGVLAVGEMLRARFGEEFHGLAERVSGRCDDADRDPAVRASPDRRGHFVEIDWNGTTSPHIPFYYSSGGYGLFVEGIRTGYFDMASRVGDRIQFQFDGASLSYHVFLADSPSEIRADFTTTADRLLPPPGSGTDH